MFGIQIRLVILHLSSCSHEFKPRPNLNFSRQIAYFAFNDQHVNHHKGEGSLVDRGCFYDRTWYMVPKYD